MKARINENGFSLIELLIVLAIIGLLVGIIIPLLLDAQDKAKQRATVAEISAWGNALGAYSTDSHPTTGFEFPDSGGAVVQANTIHSQLVPYAINNLHDNDSWGNPLWYASDAHTSYTIASGGKDGILDPNPLTGCVSPQNWRFFNLDIYLNDGVFTCSPS